jgi:hypothetical protein
MALHYSPCRRESSCMTNVRVDEVDTMVAVEASETARE